MSKYRMQYTCNLPFSYGDEVKHTGSVINPKRPGWMASKASSACGMVCNVSKQRRNASATRRTWYCSKMHCILQPITALICYFIRMQLSRKLWLLASGRLGAKYLWHNCIMHQALGIRHQLSRRYKWLWLLCVHYCRWVVDDPTIWALTDNHSLFLRSQPASQSLTVLWHSCEYQLQGI